MPATFANEVCRPYTRMEGRCGILFIHGFTGSCSHMRKLAQAMADRGYTVRTFNLPGHAQTEEAMAKTHWEDWLQAAREEASALRANVDRLVICGLSMGADISLILASEIHPSACIPISAPMGAKNILLPASNALQKVVHHLKKRKADAVTRLLDADYNFDYDGYYTSCCVDLHHIIQQAKAALKEVLCPVLAIQSDADEAIDPKSASRILKGISSRSKDLLTLHGMPHVCTISPQMEDIAQAMDTFIRKFVHQ